MNISLQLAGILLLLVILTTGLYARFLSSAVGGDQAQVAFCSVESIEDVTRYYDINGAEITGEALSGASMGVHDGDAVKKIEYTTRLTVASEVTMEYGLQLEGLPVGLAGGVAIRLDDGAVVPTVSEDGCTYYFACGTIPPTTAKTEITHTVTFEVVLSGEGQLESSYVFAPTVRMIFTQAGGEA